MFVFSTCLWKQLSYFIRAVSQVNDVRKTGGCQKSEAPKQGQAKNFQNEELTGKDSICLKQLKLKEKKRNKPTYQFTNKSLFMQNDRLLFFTASPAIVMQINNPPNLNMIQIALVRFVRAINNPPNLNMIQIALVRFVRA